MIELIKRQFRIRFDDVSVKMPDGYTENNFYDKWFMGQRNKKYSSSSKHYLSKHVLQYDLNGNLIKEHDAIMDATRSLGLKRSRIGEHCNKNGDKDVNECSIYKGYKWKFTLGLHTPLL